MEKLTKYFLAGLKKKYLSKYFAVRFNRHRFQYYSSKTSNL